MPTTKEDILRKYLEIELLVCNEDDHELILERIYCARNIYLLRNSENRVSFRFLNVLKYKYHFSFC